MEHERLFDEKQSIRESARQLKKYGSTCNHVRNNECMIRHELQKTDTLQGIALKYGCTTEQIRRANRLFAQDSLFLRQYLMIPVDREASSQFSQQTERPQSLPANSSNRMNMLDNSEPSNSKSLEDDMNHVVLSPEEENKKSIDDFLGKIDSTIAKTKKYVATSQNKLDRHNSDLFPSLNNNTTNAHASSSSSSSSSMYQNKTNSYGGHNEPGAKILVITQGRRIQSSLHKLEKQQDDFFQL